MHFTVLGQSTLGLESHVAVGVKTLVLPLANVHYEVVGGSTTLSLEGSVTLCAFIWVDTCRGLNVHFEVPVKIAFNCKGRATLRAFERFLTTVHSEMLRQPVLGLQDFFTHCAFVDDRI